MKTSELRRFQRAAHIAGLVRIWSECFALVAIGTAALLLVLL